MPTLEEVLAKEPGELTDEEKALLKENESTLDDEQKEKFKDVLAGGESGGEGEQKPNPDKPFKG